MFTGIIKELGMVKRLEKRGPVVRLTIGSQEIYNDSNIGDSISINGVCLTLVEKKDGFFSFDIMDETVRRTSLVMLKENDAVNLENALRASDKLGGHFVLGHIDCVGKVKKVIKENGGFSMDVGIPGKFDPLIVEKGSIAIDGISLTVAQAFREGFTVHLIPHTLKTTTLSTKKGGDLLNVEFDIIGKYLLKREELQRPAGLTESFLKENGF